MGPHGIGEYNENGERLLDFCAGNQLIISNTWFQHNGDRSRSAHMIDYILDYILVNKCFRASVPHD